MAIGATLSLPQTSGKFEMERIMIRPGSSGKRPGSRDSLIEEEEELRRPNAPFADSSKPRLSTTTLKYSQMPLPTPPDSAGLDGYKLQLTLMPPTPAHAPENYTVVQANRTKRRSQALPYMLTVEDVEEGSEDGAAFSPSSTNYSAASEFGSPFSRMRDSELNDVPPVPPLSPSMSNLSKMGSNKRKSRLSIQTLATEKFDAEQVVKPKNPATDSLIVLNDARRQTLASEAPSGFTGFPLTPVTPQTPISPSLPLAKAIRSSGMSLAERRALAKNGAKVPTPLASPINATSGEEPPISPPPLTSRSAAHVEAGRLATPRTATFGPVPKQEISTPRSATFAVLPAPSGVLPTPRSAAMFSPTRGAAGFTGYIPHQNVPKSPAASAAFKSPQSATFSPRSIAFSPIHEDVDRDKLKTPTAVNMLVERAQEYQQGFRSGLLSPVIKNRFETLWNVANAQTLINETFDMSIFREDSFTFTGAEHYTFGADATAAFYRLSAHPSHQQDALFSDLKIHRSNPTTQFEVPVIHLQLEAPTLEASGVVALIYPQVAGMMQEEPKKAKNGKAIDLKKNPKLDYSEEAECCRLVYEPGKGFALFHPAKDEEGGWLSILVSGRVGFDVIGANGSISITSSTHDEALVTLDFETAKLTVNTAACNTINSYYIVDVAVAAVMTVATVEGRRLRAIQEDLDQIMAYELANSPEVQQVASPQQIKAFETQNFDFTFANAARQEPKKKGGMSEFFKSLLRFLRSLGGGKKKKNRKNSIESAHSQGLYQPAPPRNQFEDFEFPFQYERNTQSRASDYPTVRLSRPQPAYVRERSGTPTSQISYVH